MIATTTITTTTKTAIIATTVAIPKMNGTNNHIFLPIFLSTEKQEMII